METVRIALVGEHQPRVTAHQAIPRALELVGRALQRPVAHEWVGTASLPGRTSEKLGGFGGVWLVPASPYESMDGALSAVRYARETNTAFLGTCGGFQHAVLEFARNVLKLEDAAHAEADPDATFPLIAPLACSLIEQEGGISLVQGSRAAEFYGADRITETYRCSYGFNPAFVPLFCGSDLRVTGVDADLEPKVVELLDHPFFVGTAFQPERSALRGAAHPLVRAFVQEASRNF